MVFQPIEMRTSNLHGLGAILALPGYRECLGNLGLIKALLQESGVLDVHCLRAGCGPLALVSPSCMLLACTGIRLAVLFRRLFLRLLLSEGRGRILSQEESAECGSLDGGVEGGVLNRSLLLLGPITRDEVDVVAFRD
jgi:hypothetical protein